MESQILYLPSDPEFQLTLIEAWDLLYGRECGTCVIGLDGMPRSATEEELEEYIEGGEYEERMSIVIPELVSGEFYF